MLICIQMENLSELQNVLTGYEVNKGTIRLSYQKNLPLELIADIAKWCWEQYSK